MIEELMIGSLDPEILHSDWLEKLEFSANQDPSTLHQ